MNQAQEHPLATQPLNPYNFKTCCDLGDKVDQDVNCTILGVKCASADYHNCRTRQAYHKDHRCG